MISAQGDRSISPEKGLFMRSLRTIFVLTSLVLLLSSTAFSQAVNGTIVGTVTDAADSGACR